MWKTDFNVTLVLSLDFIIFVLSLTGQVKQTFFDLLIHSIPSD